MRSWNNLGRVCWRARRGTDEGDVLDGVLDGGFVFWSAGTRVGAERIFAEDVEVKMVRGAYDGRVVVFFLGAMRTIFRRETESLARTFDLIRIENQRESMTSKVDEP